MDFETKLKEFQRVADASNKMSVEKFAMSGLLALALAVSEGDDEKYIQFIKNLEDMVSEKQQ